MLLETGLLNSADTFLKRMGQMVLFSITAAPTAVQIVRQMTSFY